MSREDFNRQVYISSSEKPKGGKLPERKIYSSPDLVSQERRLQRKDILEESFYNRHAMIEDPEDSSKEEVNRRLGL